MSGTLFHLAGIAVPLPATVREAKAAILRLPNHRGRFVAWLHERRAKPNVLRAALREAWRRDLGQVIEAGRDLNASVVGWFDYAQFRVPRWLPPRFDIWRGGSDVPDETIAGGLSWTLERDAACWFACRRGGSPIVVKATVGPAEVLLYDDAPRWGEIVVDPSRIGSAWAVDGTPGDWREGAQRWSERKWRSEARWRRRLAGQLTGRYQAQGTQGAP